jgi:hypothetical protein
VARIHQRWRDLLGSEANVAVEKGDLPPGTDPGQLAFDLGAIHAGTNIVSVLHEDHAVVARARTAVRSRLFEPAGVFRRLNSFPVRVATRGGPRG